MTEMEGYRLARSQSKRLGIITLTKHRVLTEGQMGITQQPKGFRHACFDRGHVAYTQQICTQQRFHLTSGARPSLVAVNLIYSVIHMLPSAPPCSHMLSRSPTMTFHMLSHLQIAEITALFCRLSETKPSLPGQRL